MKFYGHPFSSYTHKALIALYENGTPFEYGDIEDPAAAAEWAALSPVKRFPLLTDGDHVVFEQLRKRRSRRVKRRGGAQDAGEARG